ncbi:MAG TPA: CPXCG motif-containing cysteine-rich protein [Steroidobacteraceae bacterium]|nr:CPXCG motif-containing cysteine-rich protein [Steroidobacteraceae bacterium]
MKRRRSHSLDELKRRVTATDAAVIDELYGLEPVFEPELPDPATRFTTEFVGIVCPYCWERYETQVDLSAGSFSYVEDCQVCCQPIELSCEVDDDGRLVGVKPERMD